MHMNILTALLSSIIVQTAPLEEIYSDAPVVTNIIATADMTTNDVRAISGDVTSNVVTKAYIDALSSPMELPDKWALANVTNANGGTVSAGDVGALRAFDYSEGDGWRRVFISTNNYSLPNGDRVVYDPSLVYSNRAEPYDTISIYGPSGIEQYGFQKVGGNWNETSYTHIFLGPLAYGFGVEYRHNDDNTSTFVTLPPNANGYFALESSVAAAATAATNYTDTAIGAAIAPANPTFSNAVLSVGLGIDTNTVAAINALVEEGEELPIGGAATVGGLLLALAAAVAALKRTKADASALRYAMPESVALVAENDAATLVCADRAVTNATIASGFSTLNLTFPAAVSGYVRDFYLRITVAAGESAPAISVPQGITIENAGGAVPEIADGEASAAATTLVWFSETAPGVFTAKSETVKAVV